MTTTTQYMAAMKATDAARAEQRRVLHGLQGADRAKAFRATERRTLRGSKDVEVDYEIDIDDLADLGYHHTDDCDGTTPEDREHDSTAARRALSDWHDRAHGNAESASSARKREQRQKARARQKHLARKESA